MARKKQTETRTPTACCPTSPADLKCCSIDAVVPIDGRGQIVLPKEVRQKAGLGAGDKLAVISWRSGESFFVSLVKADEFAGVIKNMLGPMMQEIMAKP